MKLSIVDNIIIRNILSSSTVQLGDSNIVETRVKALAVQKEYPIYSKNEGNFANYPIFSKPLARAQISEDVLMTVTNVVPIIKTGDIKITSLSAASVLHIGNTKMVDTESIVKHFRRFFQPPVGYSRYGQPVIEIND